MFCYCLTTRFYKLDAYLKISYRGTPTAFPPHHTNTGFKAYRFLQIKRITAHLLLPLPSFFQHIFEEFALKVFGIHIFFKTFWIKQVESRNMSVYTVENICKLSKILYFFIKALFPELVWEI